MAIKQKGLKTVDKDDAGNWGYHFTFLWVGVDLPRNLFRGVTYFDSDLPEYRADSRAADLMEEIRAKGADLCPYWMLERFPGNRHLRRVYGAQKKFIPENEATIEQEFETFYATEGRFKRRNGRTTNVRKAPSTITGEMKKLASHLVPTFGASTWLELTEQDIETFCQTGLISTIGSNVGENMVKAKDYIAPLQWLADWRINKTDQLIRQLTREAGDPKEVAYFEALSAHLSQLRKLMVVTNNVRDRAEEEDAGELIDAHPLLEQVRIAEHTPTPKWIMAHLMMQLTIETGLRISEVLAFDLLNLREKKGRTVYWLTLKVVGGEYGPPKTGNREIPLTAEALRIVRRLEKMAPRGSIIDVFNPMSELPRRRNFQPAFINPETGSAYLDSKEISKQIEPMLIKAEIEFRGANQGRHTYASNHLSHGMNKAWLAMRMGTGLDMLEKHYAKYMDDPNTPMDDIAELANEQAKEAIRETLRREENATPAARRTHLKAV